MSEVNPNWLREHQLKRLDEMLLVVSEDDQVLGVDTKRNCHLNQNIEKGGTACSFVNFARFSHLSHLREMERWENLGLLHKEATQESCAFTASLFGTRF